MSNFGPLDEYIQTMSKLLTLHDQFIHAMNEGDAQMGNQLRKQFQMSAKPPILIYDGGYFLFGARFQKRSDARNR